MTVSSCHFLPELIEKFLIMLIVEESAFLLAVVKGKTCGLVKVKYQFQVILSAKLHHIVYPAVSALYRRTVPILEDVVVHREADMVKSP